MVEGQEKGGAKKKTMTHQLERVAVSRGAITIKFDNDSKFYEDDNSMLIYALRQASRRSGHKEELILLIADLDDFRNKWTPPLIREAEVCLFDCVTFSWHKSSGTLSNLASADFPINIKRLQFDGRVSGSQPLFHPSARLPAAVRTLVLVIYQNDNNSGDSVDQNTAAEDDPAQQVVLYDHCGAILATSTLYRLAIGDWRVHDDGTSRLIIDERCFRAYDECVLWLERLDIHCAVARSRESLLENLTALVHLELWGKFEPRLLYHLRAFQALVTVSATPSTCLMPPPALLGRFSVLREIGAAPNPPYPGALLTRPLEARRIPFVYFGRSIGVPPDSKYVQLISTTTLAPKFLWLLRHVGIAANSALAAQCFMAAFSAQLGKCSIRDFELLGYRLERVTVPLPLLPPLQ